MQWSTKGFVLGLMVGIIIVFMSFGLGLTFDANQEYDITITVVVCSIIGFIIGWILEGFKAKY